MGASVGHDTGLHSIVRTVRIVRGQPKCGRIGRCGRNPSRHLQAGVVSEPLHSRQLRTGQGAGRSCPTPLIEAGKQLLRVGNGPPCWESGIPSSESSASSELMPAVVDESDGADGVLREAGRPRPTMAPTPSSRTISLAISGHAWGGSRIPGSRAGQRPFRAEVNRH